MGDRRRYPRFELKIDARYRIMDSKERFKSGTTRNISAEGICFVSDRKLAIGTRLCLEVDLKDGKEAVCLIGEVRWSAKREGAGMGKEQYLNGIKLVDIPKSDEGRFLKYYCDKIVEKLSSYLKM